MFLLSKTIKNSNHKTLWIDMEKKKEDTENYREESMEFYTYIFRCSVNKI